MGAGWYNGFGGKVKKGENVEEAAKREVYEECGVKVKNQIKVGVVNFKFTNDLSKIWEVHIFLSKNFTGKPLETKEMKPKWFLVSKIPFDKMWPVDKYWLPLAIAEQKFTGKIVYNDKNEIVSFAFSLN